jgi:hypothetical protein
MVTVRQRRLLLGQLFGSLVVLAVLASAESLALDLYVSLSFVVLLVVTALTAPVHVRPAWRRRLRVPLYGGAVVFLALIGYRTVQTLLNSF